MPSTEEYSPEQQITLLRVALASIQNGLKTGKPLRPEITQYDSDLVMQRATFVTLTINDELRGCIGALKAHQPLVVDVAEHAYGAAFQDPRFPSLRADELPRLKISISILSDSSPLQFTSEEDLLAQIRPGVDGLILEENQRRGTFLPSVWESLTTSSEFLQHLKLKAGLSPDYWSDTVKISRYATFSFSETVKKLSEQNDL